MSDAPPGAPLYWNPWGVVVSLLVPAAIVSVMWFLSGWMHSVLTVDQWFYGLRHPRCAPPGAVYKLTMTATILVDGLSFYCAYSWVEMGTPRYVAAMVLLAIQTVCSLVAAIGFFAFHSFVFSLAGYVLALPAALGAGIVCLTVGEYWTNVAGGLLMAVASWTLYFLVLAARYVRFNKGGGYTRTASSSSGV